MSEQHDSRSAERKNFRCTALILKQGASPVTGRTLDISLRGISIMVPQHLDHGDAFLVAFETIVNNRKFKLQAHARAVYSICSGTSGFRTGFQFVDLDGAATQTVKDLTATLF
jgi:hypothetical protein